MFLPKLWVTIACICASITIPDTDGVPHRPLLLQKQKAVVLIFVGADCPISNSYTPEINRIIADDRSKGFDFYMVFSDPNLSIADAKKHAKDFNYTCPALMDTQQLLAKWVDATVTPEVAIVNGEGTVLYKGRIDNWYEDFGKQRFAATTHDLRDALDALSTGKKVVVPATKAVGCPIYRVVP